MHTTSSAASISTIFLRTLVPVRCARGFTYLAVMFAITLIGITLTAAARPWKMVSQREREADLLAYGIEIQQAIGAYSVTMKVGRAMPGEVYPQTLEDLTRQPAPYLRRVYRDPVAQAPFELVRAPTGGIMGVRSRSAAKPIRRREFPDAVRHFENLKSYRDWVFQHPNASGSTWPKTGFGGSLAAGGMVPIETPGQPPPPTAPSGSQTLPGVQTTPVTPPTPTTSDGHLPPPSEIGSPPLTPNPNPSP